MTAPVAGLGALGASAPMEVSGSKDKADTSNSDFDFIRIASSFIFKNQLNLIVIYFGGVATPIPPSIGGLA